MSSLSSLPDMQENVQKENELCQDEAAWKGEKSKLLCQGRDPFATWLVFVLRGDPGDVPKRGVGTRDPGSNPHPAILCLRQLQLSSVRHSLAFSIM